MKLKYFSAVSALIALVSNAWAVDWVYDESKGVGNVYWEASLGSAGVDGSWYYMNGTEKVYMQGTYSENDTFSIGSSTQTSAISLKVDKDITCAGFTYTSASGILTTIAGTNNAINFTVNGNFTNGTTAQVAPSLQNMNVRITGDYIMGRFWTAMTNTSGIYIGGNAIGTSIQPTFGANRANSSISNPDMEIVGYISNSQWTSFNGAAKDVYYKIGGFEKTGLVRIFNSSKANFTTNFIFTNAAGTNYANTGNTAIVEVFGNSSNDKKITVNPLERSRASLMINMDSTATQTIGDAGVGGSEGSGSGMLFSGGVIMNSGTLRLRFGQESKYYTYKASYKKNVADTAAKTYTVSYWTGDKDDLNSVQTSSSHGDLVMNGGVFSSLASTAAETYGAFRFTNIEYKGGAIKLRLTDENRIDSIDLRSFYQKEVNDADASDIYYTKEAGGTVKFADGVAAGTKVVFDFGASTDVNWLIDSELNEGKGAKIISWDASNKTLLSEKDFYAAGFTSVDDYEAKFTITDDGLYVKYIIAVPEPATVAALFGALALGLAVWRRRK